jgi:hypothetical protein
MKKLEVDGKAKRHGGEVLDGINGIDRIFERRMPNSRGEVSGTKAGLKGFARPVERVLDSRLT